MLACRQPVLDLLKVPRDTARRQEEAARESGVKDWSVARVFIEGDAICHQSSGAFFTRKGATKAHLTALGVAFDEAEYESIDDYA